MLKFSFNKDGIIPDWKILRDALTTGITATVIVFLIDFFGLKPFFDWIPQGWELFFIVFASAYLSNLIKLTY